MNQYNWQLNKMDRADIKFGHICVSPETANILLSPVYRKHFLRVRT